MNSLLSSRFSKTILLAAGILLLVPSLAQARDITGKVVAVFTEPVTINQKVLDKVSVTVASCPTGKYETVVYSPGSVSEDNALGFLFEHSVQQGRSPSLKTPFMNMVNGHMTFTVPDNGTTVQKAVFWGANYECGVNVAGNPGGGSGAGAANPNGGMLPPNAGSQSRPPVGGNPQQTKPPLGGGFGGLNPFINRLPGF